MNLLAIDTSMAACSVALLRQDGGGEHLPVHQFCPAPAAPAPRCLSDRGQSAPAPGLMQLFRRFEAMERGHAEALFPMIAAVMAEAGVAFADLATIAVTLGPGTFTGVRAGIAAARGLALAAKLPVVGAGSLEVMAQGCLRLTSEAERAGGFMVAHDARRGEFYCQSFDAGGRPLSEPAIMTAAEAAPRCLSDRGQQATAPRCLSDRGQQATAGKLPAMSFVAGSGAAAVAGEAQRIGRDLQAVFPALLPDAADLARLALNLPHCEHPPTPLYLRMPDAKTQSDKILARA